jgi:hypothetical protein
VRGPGVKQAPNTTKNQVQPAPEFRMSAHPTAALNASILRERLMAPEPMPRIMALHALEEEIEHLQGSDASTVALAHAAARFVERGIPYYNLQDPHYQAWVGKAVSYWEKLHGSAARAN